MSSHSLWSKFSFSSETQREEEEEEEEEEGEEEGKREGETYQLTNKTAV